MAKTNLQGALPYNEKQIQEVIDRCGMVLVARKVDGVRAELIISQGGEVTALSRSGKPLPALQAFFDDPEADAISHRLESYFPYGGRLDVEVTLDGHTFQKGCGILRTSTPDKIAKIDYSQVRLWPIGDLSGTAPPAYRHRALMGDTLVKLFAECCGFQVGYTERHCCESLGWVKAAYEAFREEGFEGCIVYDPDAPHREGKVLGWWKVKPEEEADGVIIDLEEGEGRLKGTMGAAVVRLEDGTVTKVGTGWDDPTRDALWELYVLAPSFPKSDCIHQAWRRCVQITFMERTDDGNIRHPAFDRFRDTEDNPGEKT